MVDGPVRMTGAERSLVPVCVALEGEGHRPTPSGDAMSVGRLSICFKETRDHVTRNRKTTTDD